MAAHSAGAAGGSSTTTTRHALALLRLPAAKHRQSCLLRQLAWRACAARHAWSSRCWLWTPLTIASQFAHYMMVFAAILQIKVEGLGIDVARPLAVGFGVFLITRPVRFGALADLVRRATRVFRAHARVVQRLHSPAERPMSGNLRDVLRHHAIVFPPGDRGPPVARSPRRGRCSLARRRHAGAVGWRPGGLRETMGALLPDMAEVVDLALEVLSFAVPIVYPLALARLETIRAAVEANPMTPLGSGFRAELPVAKAPSLSVLADLVVGDLRGGAAMISARWDRSRTWSTT